jgi:hypothetical protein
MNYPDSVADEWLRYCLRTLIGDYDRYVMEKQLGIQMPDINTGILVYDLD